MNTNEEREIYQLSESIRDLAKRKMRLERREQALGEALAETREQVSEAQQTLSLARRRLDEVIGVKDR